MHNRKKLDRPPTDAEVAALEKKTQTYASLVSIIFQRRAAKDMTAETLSLVGKLIKNNPDFYSLWNFRREILLHMNTGLQECTNQQKYNASNANDLRDDELNLSAEGILRNPKSYCAWHHRIWVMSKFDVDYKKELELCKEFLRQDQRNFHCWNYRRKVVAIANIPAEDELAYSQEKIQENFSNYSAFHHRSTFLLKTAPSLTEVLPREFTIVENAIFTEPDDQSAWWYHQFLTTWAVKEIQAKHASGDQAGAATLAEWFVGVLLQQLELVRGLYELEDKSTWVLNSMVAMLDTLTSQALESAVAATAGASAAEMRTERCALLEKLLEVDPNHRHRYRYMLLHAND